MAAFAQFVKISAANAPHLGEMRKQGEVSKPDPPAYAGDRSPTSLAVELDSLERRPNSKLLNRRCTPSACYLGTAAVAGLLAGWPSLVAGLAGILSKHDNPVVNDQHDVRAAVAVDVADRHIAGLAHFAPPRNDLRSNSLNVIPVSSSGSPA